MRSAVIQKHQTLIDLALQYCGNADALFSIAELNDLEPTQDVAPGTVLLIPEVIDKQKVKYLTDGDYRPVTAFPIDQRLEGLDYWAIEMDFIIT